MTELLELRGVVEASPDVVAAVLLDVGPGGRSPLAVSGVVEKGDGDELVVILDGSRMTVTVDQAARSVALQGEWWYRGVTSVEPDPRGSVVIHRIYNVAPGHRWAVRMIARGPVNAAPTAFATNLEQLSRELGVAAWVVTD
ncbi:hypothetical protein Aph02nite_53710 [Actinoplanes philippinensis]|uniref:Polyketide cyclase / dehydrase and lipid transport n=1 Tax=Actinoplanes philippinensis TaxID=35752 RepID=A0A1I2J8K2_9ACTN|nr:hypothetical protein [Actinoplanes philippinensis]GIE79421.1 hypothetical protein Aph02nite_53710 [Actinoplanes philippinensis]SFF50378.1 hypothetical protein SAMN05421541_111432 [Actinoplanes philippinensis]